MKAHIKSDSSLCRLALTPTQLSAVLLVWGSLVCTNPLSVFPPQLHLVGGGEARRGERRAVVFPGSCVFTGTPSGRGGVSSLLLAFEVREQHLVRSLQALCPKPRWLPVHSPEMPRASGKRVNGVSSFSPFLLSTRVSCSSVAVSRLTATHGAGSQREHGLF